MYLQINENYHNTNGNGFIGNTYLHEKHLIRHPLKNKNTAWIQIGNGYYMSKRIFDNSR